MQIQRFEIYFLLTVTFVANLFAVFFIRSPQAYASEKTTAIISGIVIAKNDQTLTVRNGLLKTSVSIPQGIQVKRNSFLATLNDVKVGDHVAIAQNLDGSIQAMEVMSGEILHLGKWAIPLAFGGSAALMLMAVLSRKLREYTQRMELSGIQRVPFATTM